MGKRVRELAKRMQSLRDVQRKRRSDALTVGIIGYTNVGKSLLVNRLTGSNLVVRDGMFATVEVAARRLSLPSGADCVVLDGVGLVKDLPHELVDAFAATVEELQEADLVLHVRDPSHPSHEEHFKVVVAALERADIDIHRRVMEVWNKSDLFNVQEARRLRIVRHSQSYIDIHIISALLNDGIDELIQAMDKKLQELAALRGPPGHSSKRGAIEDGWRRVERVIIPYDLPRTETAKRWKFIQNEGSILEDSIRGDEAAVIIDVWMDPRVRARCVKQFGADMLS